MSDVEELKGCNIVFFHRKEENVIPFIIVDRDYGDGTEEMWPRQNNSSIYKMLTKRQIENFI